MLLALLFACDRSSPCGDFATGDTDACTAALVVSACPDLPAPRDHLGTVRVDVAGTPWILATGGLDFGLAGAEAQRAHSDFSYASVVDGALGAWQTGTLPEARAGHGIAALGERVYLLGGLVDFGDGEIGAEHWVTDVLSGVFDPASGTFTDVRTEAPLPEGLWHIQATVIDGELVAVGGRTPTGDASTMSVRAVLDGDGITAWEPWSLTLAEPRTHHGLAVHGSRVFLAGGLGRNGQDLPGILAADTEAPGPFALALELEQGRVTPGTFVLGDLLVVAGGLTLEGSLASIETFPVGPLGPTWTVTADDLPEGVGHIHLVPVVDDSAFVIGGRVGAEGSTAGCAQVRMTP